MLSGETAAGSYPVEAVQYMAKIAEKTETILNHEEFLSQFLVHHSQKTNDVQAVSFSVANMANLTKPKAILTTTTSGQTPRLVSRFRPSAPILCATWNQKTQLQMSLVWGCEAIFVGLPSTTDEIIANAIDGFSRLKRLKSGDKVIVTAGVPAGIAGHTNMILNQIV